MCKYLPLCIHLCPSVQKLLEDSLPVILTSEIHVSNYRCSRRRLRSEVKGDGREMGEEGKGEGAWLSEHRAKICLANTLPVSCIQPTGVWRQKKPSYSPSAHIVFSLQSICRFVCYMPRVKENTAVHGGDGVGVVVQYRIDAILAGGTFKICVMIYQSLFFYRAMHIHFFFFTFMDTYDWEEKEF